MKPTRQDIVNALWNSPSGFSGGVDAIVELIDRHQKEGMAEREHGRLALAAFRQFGWHRSTCPRVSHRGTCDCGYSAALDSLAAACEDLPNVEEVVGVLAEARLADDVEQYNREMRIRREAYAAGMRDSGGNRDWSPEQKAAARYPLRKRVPKVIPDPHGDFVWRCNGQAADWRDAFEYSCHQGAVDSWKGASDLGATWSEPRVRVLSALLDDPWTYEESTEVEP